MTKKFQRTIEDFLCENCGETVHGNGYTNHCPNCLWSKHVDINPGDRAFDCRGLMEPIQIENKQADYIITHYCQKCGHHKKNKTTPTDNFHTILQISESGTAKPSHFS